MWGFDHAPGCPTTRKTMVRPLSDCSAAPGRALDADAERGLSRRGILRGGDADRDEFLDRPDG